MSALAVSAHNPDMMNTMEIQKIGYSGGWFGAGMHTGTLYRPGIHQITNGW